MSEIDKIARGFMDSMPDSSIGLAADFPDNSFVVLESEAIYAVRAALLTAPPGWKLVPVEPTGGMFAAALRSPCSGHPETGSQSYSSIYKSMIATAPEPK